MNRLLVTGAAPALRSGVGQSHIAMIEKGRLEAHMSTLRRLFDALFCDFVVLPIPRRRPGDVVAERTLGARLGPIWD